MSSPPKERSRTRIPEIQVTGASPSNAESKKSKSASEKWGQLYDDLLPPHSNDEDAQRVLFECSKGTHKPLWYKFKRFESLALLNLYHYQHELTLLEADISNFRPADSAEADERGPGVMTGEQIHKMRRLLKEYYKAILQFRDISLVKRPSMEERQATARILKDNLQVAHYTEAADAYGMLTLDPTSLGVEADGIRVFMAKVMTKFRGRPVLSSTDSESNCAMNPTVTTMAHFIRDASSSSVNKNLDAASSEDVEAGRPPSGHQLGETDEGALFQLRLPDSPHDSRPEKSEKSKSEILLFAGRPYQIPITNGVDTIARMVLSVLAAIVLLAPMFALSYISSKGYQLMTTSLFVLLFAAVLSLSSKATNQELIVAVAAYTAVLVVFIGQAAT
jgi:hypothetical protein